MNKSISSSNSKSKLILIICLIITLPSINFAQANTVQNEKHREKVSVSFADLEQNISTVSREQFIKNNQKLSTIVKGFLPSSGENRQIKKQSQNNKPFSKNQVVNNDTYQFSIFDAHSMLLTDEDYDGFYQSFSVTFDADYLRYDSFDQATVYAELYLSRNGGPWLHYFTTEDFNIISDNSDDDYEVITTLIDGYVSDNYEVLIDLYEVGYPDIVATFSSDDSNALFALPLESTDYDLVQPEQISYSEGYGGGSMSYFSIIILLLLTWYRLKLPTQASIFLQTKP